ncbi:hypothetical protein LOAG_11464, partial [Loa loa]
MDRSYHIILSFLILPLICQERNTTNVVDIRDENHKATKFVAIILFTVFVFYGIISNTLMVTVLLHRGENSQYNHEFIFIALQLIISHFIAFLPQMAVVLPELLQTKNNSY